MATIERSISDVLQDIIRNIQEIVRSEVRLAKTEIREEASKAKTAGAMVGAGAVSAIFGVFFLLLAIVYALIRVVPDWAAALMVSIFLTVAAGLLVTAGVRQFKQVHPTPDKTVENVKENVKWAKQQIK
jgi:uncharacterized membrane protein YqjE